MLLIAMLFPVGIYLAILGWINRRSHGLLVSGPTDFSGLLFAASGFLMLGGPALLDSLGQTDAWRRFWLRGRINLEAPLTERLELGRAIIYSVYFVLVVVVVSIMLWRRRRLTAIYNVDPHLVETVLGQTFERLGLSFVQTGNILLIQPEPSAPPIIADPAEHTVSITPATVLVEKVTTLEVEAVVEMAHVSLWWDPSNSLLRREVELDLRRALAEQFAPDHGAGDWMLLASSILFFLLVLAGGILLLLRFTKA